MHKSKTWIITISLVEGGTKVLRTECNWYEQEALVAGYLKNPKVKHVSVESVK